MSSGGSSRTIAPSHTAELLHRPTSVVSSFPFVYVVFERGIVYITAKAGGARSPPLFLCVFVAALQRAREPAPCGAAPSHLELVPDVAVPRTLNYRDHRWDLCSWLLYLSGHSWVARYWLVLPPAFLYEAGQRLKNHSGAPWNGMLDISSQVFQAAALLFVYFFSWFMS